MTAPRSGWHPCAPPSAPPGPSSTARSRNWRPTGRAPRRSTSSGSGTPRSAPAARSSPPTASPARSPGGHVGGRARRWEVRGPQASAPGGPGRAAGADPGRHAGHPARLPAHPGHGLGRAGRGRRRGGDRAVPAPRQRHGRPGQGGRPAASPARRSPSATPAKTTGPWPSASPTAGWSAGRPSAPTWPAPCSGARRTASSNAPATTGCSTRPPARSSPAPRPAPSQRSACARTPAASGPWGPTRPTCREGHLDARDGLKQMADGEIRGLLGMCNNPFVSLPNQAVVRAGYDALEFHVQSDFFLSETAARADVVLPATVWAEDEGLTTNGEGRVVKHNKAVEPPGEARTDWEMLCELARRLGSGDKFPFTEPGRDPGRAAGRLQGRGGRLLRHHLREGRGDRRGVLALPDPGPPGHAAAVRGRPLLPPRRQGPLPRRSSGGPRPSRPTRRSRCG